MKIKLLTSLAGANYSYGYGEITDKIDEKTAKNLISKGLAEKVATKARSKK